MSQEINKVWKLGRLQTRLRWRSSKQFMGRFGGGWNWKLAVQWSGTTLLLSCLILEITFTYCTDAHNKGIADFKQWQEDMREHRRRLDAINNRTA